MTRFATQTQDRTSMGSEPPALPPLPMDDDETISVISDISEQSYSDMPVLISIQFAFMAAQLVWDQFSPDQEKEEEVDRVLALLNFCIHSQDAIEREFDADLCDYVTGEEIAKQEEVYQLDDCDGNPLKLSTLLKMLNDYGQYKNPRTRSSILYFTKLRVI